MIRLSNIENYWTEKNLMNILKIKIILKKLNIINNEYIKVLVNKVCRKL